MTSFEQISLLLLLSYSTLRCGNVYGLTPTSPLASRRYTNTKAITNAGRIPDITINNSGRIQIQSHCRIRRAVHEYSNSNRLFAFQPLHMVTSSNESSNKVAAAEAAATAAKTNTKKTYAKHQHHHHQQQQQQGRRKPYKKKISKKQLIRAMFRQAKEMERTGKWREACDKLEHILEIEPRDSYSYLALARLQSRREKSIPGQNRNRSQSSQSQSQVNGEHSSTRIDDDQSNFEITPTYISETQPFSKARQVFYEGTENCPRSIHIWQAWALHEQSQGNISYAKSLFEKALEIDESNPYVCHGYGLLEHQCGNYDKALELWQSPIQSRQKGKTTAALVCSIGKLMVAKGQSTQARDLYMQNVLHIDSEREKSEVYLAAAWLEEKHFKQMDRAEELLQLALRVSPGNSRAMVALARLEGRRVDLERSKIGPNSNSFKTTSKGRKQHTKDTPFKRDIAIKNKLKDACKEISKNSRHKSSKKSEVKDGRLFNAWAKLEVKDGHYVKARDILQKGIEEFPEDHSLLQAAGKVEERLGNFTGARDLFSESLLITPSAPALLGYAMLEINHPTERSFQYKKIARLFQEALLLDPRHGPVYNAYGNMELKMGNVQEARQIFQNGVYANCRDVASVYHGLAMLELSLGNIKTARLVLRKGLKEVRVNDSGMDSDRRKRAVFLAHTLGMLELNCNQPAEAKAIFKTGIEQHGGSSQLLLGAALAEVKLGNDDEARKLFERSVTVDQKHAQAWQTWGVFEMRTGNYKVAKTLFECGIKNDPEHGALWQAYATMESRRRNIDIARVLFAAGVTKCPKHIPLYQAWSCLELRDENYEKARTLITEALTRDKKRGTGWLVAAKIEEKMGNEGLVGLILRRGIECAPHSAKLYCALAEYEVQRGKFDVGRELLEKGLEVDPLHAPLYHSLAELEARVFNIEGLAALNKRAAEVFNANTLEPPSSEASMTLLGNKLRKNSLSKKKLPTIVATLAKMASFDLDIEEIANDFDPDTLIENMGGVDNESTIGYPLPEEEEAEEI